MLQWLKKKEGNDKAVVLHAAQAQRIADTEKLHAEVTAEVKRQVAAQFQRDLSENEEGVRDKMGMVRALMMMAWPNP